MQLDQWLFIETEVANAGWIHLIDSCMKDAAGRVARLEGPHPTMQLQEISGAPLMIGVDLSIEAQV